jgi:serine/threonine protein kinase
LKGGKKPNKLILKLGDFGFATLVTPEKKLEQYCGTPIYAAPEVEQTLCLMRIDWSIFSLMEIQGIVVETH